MKAILFCVCALVLCAYVTEADTFKPADIPCATKIFYTEIFDKFDETGNKTTRLFSGFLAMYGRYMTQYELEKGAGDVFGVIRVDMPDPKDPNTASLYFGVNKNVTECIFMNYYPVGNFSGLGYERGYFLDEFEYTSKEKSTFKGISCMAYIKTQGDEKFIHYVNDQDRTIGYEYISDEMHRTWDAAYQFYTEPKDFRMPGRFPGCPSKVYDNIQDEPNCTLSSDSSSSGASTVEITFATLFIAIAISLLAMF